MIYANVSRKLVMLIPCASLILLFDILTAATLLSSDCPGPSSGNSESRENIGKSKLMCPGLCQERCIVADAACEKDSACAEQFLNDTPPIPEGTARTHYVDMLYSCCLQCPEITVRSPPSPGIFRSILYAAKVSHLASRSCLW